MARIMWVKLWGRGTGVKGMRMSLRYGASEWVVKVVKCLVYFCKIEISSVIYTLSF